MEMDYKLIYESLNREVENLEDKIEKYNKIISVLKDEKGKLSKSKEIFYYHYCNNYLKYSEEYMYSLERDLEID